MSLSKFSVNNPVLVNVIMIVVIVVGAYSLITLPRELAPEVKFNWVFIFTLHPGVSPEEIEKLITIPLEEEIQDVDGINEVTSISREGASFVWVKFETMDEYDFNKRFQDLRFEVDRVPLPDGAEDPLLQEFTTSEFLPLIQVVLHGDLSEKEVKKAAEDLEDDILDIKQVAKAGIFGVRDREIWVEVDPTRLENYNLALAQVVDAIKAKNLNLTAGDIKMGRWEYLIRTVGEIEQPSDLEQVIIRSTPNGGHIKVGDVAQVRDTFEDREVISRFDGAPSVTLTVTKKIEGNALRIIDQIKALGKEYEERYDGRLKVSFNNDSSIWIEDILGTLQNNAALGLVLLIIVLYLFLGWRNALFAGIGIPVTFMTAFFFMKQNGETMNGNALFGLVLVLGMVVDDAIVIVENCYRYLQKGYSPKEAAIQGTREVALPVITSSATTVAAFLPLMLMPGIIGKFMRIVPVIVSLALLASLIESLLILPSHFAEWSRGIRGRTHTGVLKLSSLMSGYSRLLRKLLRRRYAVVGLAGVFLVMSAPLAFVIGVDLFADEDIGQFHIRITMPEGTRLEITDAVVKQIEERTLGLPGGDVRHVVANTGMLQTEGEWFFKPSVGQVLVDLHHKSKRKRPTVDVMNELREVCRDVSGPMAMEFKLISSGPPTDPPVSVKVKGEYLEELQKVADLVKAELAKMEGVKDIRDDFVPGKRELKVVVDEGRAHELGLSVAQVALALRNAFDGEVATTFRDGVEEIDVLVKYAKPYRNTVKDLENVRLVTPMGQAVAFKDIATITEGPGYATIKHDENDRVIKVTADVDKRVTSSQEVNKALVARFADISERFPGYRLDFGGQFEEFIEAFRDLTRLFGIGILIMYVILAGQFKSFVRPIIIFQTILFAFVGAIYGLVLVNSPFSINNLFGLVAVAGVAVNDALVLMSFIINARERGVSRWKSIMWASRTRLRPILLTSITTIIGLLPMALGIGGRSEVWAPLAVVVAGGLASATVLTLLIVPCVYAIGDDIQIWINRKLRRGTDGRLMAPIREDRELASRLETA